MGPRALRLISFGAVLALGACGDDGDPSTPFDFGVRDLAPGGDAPDFGFEPFDFGSEDSLDGGEIMQPDAGVADAGEDMSDSGPRPDGGFPQPSNTVPVNFSLDDRANRSYTAMDGLAWSGTFNFNEPTRIAGFDARRQPPFPLLYDDGPWTFGGHEPEGATANDNVWGITVFITPPTMNPLTFEYTTARRTTQGSTGEEIWLLYNEQPGAFTLAPGQRQAITAIGLAIPAWGPIDFRITLDTALMAMMFRQRFNPAQDQVLISSSQWGWADLPMNDDGRLGDRSSNDGIYTFQLLPNVGPGTTRQHSGGMNGGDVAQFTLKIGFDDYVGPVSGLGTAPLADGIFAELSTDGGTTWRFAPIGRAGTDNNTALTAPN